MMGHQQESSEEICFYEEEDDSYNYQEELSKQLAIWRNEAPPASPSPPSSPELWTPPPYFNSTLISCKEDLIGCINGPKIYATTGFSFEFYLTPCVKITIDRGEVIDSTYFVENDWHKFLQLKPFADEYFDTEKYDAYPSITKRAGCDSVMFYRDLYNLKCVKIDSDCYYNTDSIYLEKQQLYAIFALGNLITCRLQLLSSQGLLEYHRNVIKSASRFDIVRNDDDIIAEVNQIVKSHIVSQNLCSMLEIIHYFPKKVVESVREEEIINYRNSKNKL